MSLIPFMLEDLVRPINLFDQNFGVGLLDNDLPVLTRSAYYRPWRHLPRQQSGTSSVAVRDNVGGFQVNLDVQQFQPEEVSVKVVDNCVVVEGKHEEKQDEHGYISRHFVRRYVLPDGVDDQAIQCKLSSDGVLNVLVPKKVEASSNERVIPITQTHQPAVKRSGSTATAKTAAAAAPDAVPDNKEEEEEEEEKASE